MLRKLTTALLIACSTQPALAQTYFCSGEVSAGFRDQNDQWDAVVFNTEGDQFTVSPSDENRTTIFGPATYAVTRLGSASPHLYCADGEEILCGGLVVGFVLNKRTLRFHSHSGVGYVDGFDGSSSTPNITAGKCSKL